jgi:F420H(2)-dependent quinone reductase
MPLIRIEHHGTCAVIASNAGAPRDPFWCRNFVANPLIDVQDGAVKQKDAGQRSLRQTKGRMVEASGGRCLFDVPYLPSLCGL